MHDNICTYVDDFLISAKDSLYFMSELNKIYTIKDPKFSNIYLGALCTGNLDANLDDYFQEWYQEGTEENWHKTHEKNSHET